MADDPTTRRLRVLYSLLLQLYPRAFRDRFGASMRQTFVDLCRERRADGRGLVGFVLWSVADTLFGILRERSRTLVPARRNLVRVAAITLALLAIPFVAMQFSDEVAWTPSDFVFAGVMIAGTGLTFEFVVASVRTSTYRLATAAALGTTFLLIWVNMAVGLIGSEDNPANALYLAVLIVFAVGSVASRLRARAMSRAMFATAAVQIAIPFVAMAIWRPEIAGGQAMLDLVRLIFLNAFFGLSYVGAGALYRAADHDEIAPSSRMAR